MRFQRKPIIVEAFRLPGEQSFDACGFYKWAAEQNWAGFKVVTRDGGYRYVQVMKMDGSDLAWPGDWIVRGQHGEFFVMSPGRFHEDFTPINETEGVHHDKAQALSPAR